MRRTSTAGFTLIELLIVVVIIGLLASVALPRYADAKARSYRAAAMGDLKRVASAQVAFWDANRRFGNTTDTLAMGVSISRGVSQLQIVGDTLQWNALVRTVTGSSCAMKSGPAAPDPAGWSGPSLADGIAACIE